MIVLELISRLQEFPGDAAVRAVERDKDILRDASNVYCVFEMRGCEDEPDHNGVVLLLDID